LESGAEEDLCTFLTGFDGFFSFTLSRSLGLCFGFVLSAVKRQSSSGLLLLSKTIKNMLTEIKLKQNKT